MGQMHCCHKLVLELGLDGSFNILDPTSSVLCLAAPISAQQRNACTITSCVARSMDLLQFTIGDQPYDHGTLGVNIASKSSSEHDSIHRLETCTIH